MSWAIFCVILLYHNAQFMDAFRFQYQNREVLGWFEKVLWILYFILVEGIVGASLGKWLVGLRVSRTDRGGPPGLARGLIRALVFYAVVQLPSDLAVELTPSPQGPRMYLKYLAYDWIIQGLGRNRACLDDAPAIELSGAPRMAQRHTCRSGASAEDPPDPAALLLSDSRPTSGVHSPAPASVRQIGPYAVRGTIRWQDDHKILLGEDSTLERPVWIVIRAARASAPSPARRVLNRRTRPRWIGGGDESDARWDAFTAPSGFPLTDLVKAGGLPWSEALPLLRELAEELEIAYAEDTLPDRLSPEQVWIHPDGSVQLIDLLDSPQAVTEPGRSGQKTLIPAAARAGATSGAAGSNREEQRALHFLGEVARRALEGHPQLRPAAKPADARSVVDDEGHELAGQASGDVSGTVRGRRIEAAVPERSRFMLDRLTGVRVPFASLADLRAGSRRSQPAHGGPAISDAASIWRFRGSSCRSAWP